MRGDSGSVVVCGNGFIDEFETCDPAFQTDTLAFKCDCDDGNPCTIDRCREGTSADTCDCVCEHVDQSNVVGIGTCNDSDACTNDVTACADPLDERSSAECEAACAITCDHVRLPECIPGCGNGVADPGETCETDILGRPPTGLPPCTCDDGNACTLDIPSGNAATCTLTCRHVDRTQIGPESPNARDGYGYGHCDDKLVCTADSGADGDRDLDTCQLPCAHAPIAGWEATACNDMNACTVDGFTQSDVSTCSVMCSHTTQTGYNMREPGGCTMGSGVCAGAGFTTYPCDHPTVLPPPWSTGTTRHAAPIVSASAGASHRRARTVSTRRATGAARRGRNRPRSCRAVRTDYADG